ncbi:hypothetical protein KHA94_24270 [Bacillus sp. FJAT-49705]|uniref:Uncharacterized protein n=1 Tax=Cytobacillus citreus TaxID=2833586 RepID=A0ABS5NZE4_9BACI|nr:hypothetical protein [Cytobacillus citreus]MBS4193212.1 hypothetical protein [Cytobacillus citreus]
MTNGGSIDFSINRNLAEKFSMALKLNNESSKDVITRLMNQYVAETFSKVSNEATIQISGRAGDSSSPSIVEKKKENAKITNEMVASAYKYAKKVYFGEMTRQASKIAVSKASGMNEGSAQDYITDFLAMMEVIKKSF